MPCLSMTSRATALYARESPGSAQLDPFSGVVEAQTSVAPVFFNYVTNRSNSRPRGSQMANATAVRSRKSCRRESPGTIIDQRASGDAGCMVTSVKPIASPMSWPSGVKMSNRSSVLLSYMPIRSE